MIGDHVIIFSMVRTSGRKGARLGLNSGAYYRCIWMFHRLVTGVLLRTSHIDLRVSAKGCWFRLHLHYASCFHSTRCVLCS